MDGIIYNYLGFVQKKRAHSLLLCIQYFHQFVFLVLDTTFNSFHDFIFGYAGREHLSWHSMPKHCRSGSFASSSLNIFITSQTKLFPMVLQIIFPFWYYVFCYGTVFFNCFFIHFLMSLYALIRFSLLYHSILFYHNISSPAIYGRS